MVQHKKKISDQASACTQRENKEWKYQKKSVERVPENKEWKYQQQSIEHVPEMVSLHWQEEQKWPKRALFTPQI